MTHARARGGLLAGGALVLALGSIAFAQSSSPPPGETVDAIEHGEFDSEGGSSSVVVYANGFVRAEGQASCCGYHPPLATGWYRVQDAAALRALFARASRWVRNHPHPSPAPPGSNEFTSETTLSVGGRWIPWIDNEPPPVGAIMVAGSPFGLRVVPVRDANVPASLRH